MSLTTDLLIFLAAFIIVNYKGVNAGDFALDVDDEEESLKQAIFLVELLKSGRFCDDACLPYCTVCYLYT